MSRQKSEKIDFDALLENENIVQRDIIDEVEDATLNYAVKTIVDRALPDVRDGLKPAQRRILYAMHDLRLTPDKPYKKSANVSGHVMAKYHPHGDTYGVMANMVNPLGIRYPVVDGQGNFGHPLDGDGPAASRYTEARLHKVGMAMLKDVDKKVVDFQPNYSEEDEEPIVLPAGAPFLLMNGATGIATGYTTEIPSHNLGELVDGINALIKNPEITTLELMQYIKGPDLPTGGVLVNDDNLIKLYETGQASLRFRAKITTEVNESGNTQIVITELPPDLRKASVDKSVGIVEKLYQLCVQDKKIPRVIDVRDESEGKVDKKTGLMKDPVRIVIELHKTALPEVIISELYKQTALDKTKGYIMRAIVNQAPAILSLKEMLEHYLEHRREVVRRRIEHDLDKAQKRLHILQGFKIVYTNLDDVIKTIRNSSDPEVDLVAKYSFSKEQVKSILSMPLRSLSKLESDKIETEIKEREDEIEMYEFVLSEQEEIDNIVSTELNEIKEQFGDKRKTKILKEEELNKTQDIATDEKMVAILTTKNTIKLIPEETLEEMHKNGVLRERQEIYKQAVRCNIDDEFIVIFNTGEYIRVKFNDLLLMDFLEDREIIAFFVLDKDENTKKQMVLMTKNGLVKKSNINTFKARLKRIVPYINLTDDDEIIRVKISDGDELNNTIVVATEKGLIHRFSENAFTASRPGGKGVPGIAPAIIEEGDRIADFDITKKDDDDKKLVVMYIVDKEDNIYMKSMNISDFMTKGRVSRGIVGACKNFSDKVYKVKVIDDDFTIIDTKGNVRKQKLVSIPIQSRYNKPEPINIKPLTIDFYLE